MKSPYFKFYVQDFLNGVKHFSAEEVGAYTLMLCEQWDAGFVEKDEKILKKISRISSKKREKVVKKFKETESGQLQNFRLEEERSKYIEFVNKQASNGSKGGRKSKKSNPTLNPNESQNKPNANPTLNPNESLSLSGNTNVLPMSDVIVKDTNVSGAPALAGDRPDHAPSWEKVYEAFYKLGKPDEAQTFFNHYEATGWMIGSSKITSVQALANKWMANPVSQAKEQQAVKGRKVIMEWMEGGEESWTEERYRQYCNNPAASGYTFRRYE